MLSILFDLPTQASAIVTHLVTSIYNSRSLSTTNSTGTPFFTLVYLLVALLNEYPSQTTFQSALHRPSTILQVLPYRTYILELSSALRSTNYAKLGSLTRTSHPSLAHLDLDSDSSKIRLHTLAYLFRLLSAKVRWDAWLVMRSSYREITVAGDGKVWLERCLNFGESGENVERWMKERTDAGEAALKGETGERWMLYKTAIPVQR